MTPRKSTGTGVRAAAAILLGLAVLCALASLSGCLTPPSSQRWPRERHA